MSVRPYLDYYIANKIIPVRQDIADLDKHFRRREALYRHLGILPSAVRGRKVIEFGPGTGDNAIYTASLKPELYTFVDANPLSIAHLRKKGADGWLPAGTVEYVETDVYSFTSAAQYDLVLCEGIVHIQRDPTHFLQHMAHVAAPDGIVVATTHSAISLFPEICRRIIYPIFTRVTPERQPLLRRLVQFFERDLTYLPGMSRLPEDWAQDNIMQPWPDADQVVFTIEDAINALDGEFDLVSTSPRFLQDWRWYKAVAEDPISDNRRAITEAKRWSIGLLDHRIEPHDLQAPDFDLEQACFDAINRCAAAWRSGKDEDIRRFLADVEAISSGLETVSPRTSRSLRDFVAGVNGLLAGQSDADFGDFRSLFGRAQQYVSFIRRNQGLGPAG
jgi:ubiquinone/menaquinone biosynthesis C-methylase UbiE